MTPAGAMILLENVKKQNMCSSCLDATVIAIVSLNILDFRNSLINEGVSKILRMMEVHCNGKIVKPAIKDEEPKVVSKVM